MSPRSARGEVRVEGLGGQGCEEAAGKLDQDDVGLRTRALDGRDQRLQVDAATLSAGGQVRGDGRLSATPECFT